MYIEVTEKTFYKIFECEPLKVEEHAMFKVYHYLDDDLEQCGKKIFNYISSNKWQYYLSDINY